MTHEKIDENDKAAALSLKGETVADFYAALALMAARAREADEKARYEQCPQP